MSHAHIPRFQLQTFMNEYCMKKTSSRTSTIITCREICRKDMHVKSFRLKRGERGLMSLTMLLQ